MDATNLLRSACGSARVPMTIADPSAPDCPVVYANEAFEALTGYSNTKIVGSNCRFLQGPDTDPLVVRSLHEKLASRSEAQCSLLNYTIDGTPFFNYLYIQPVNFGGGKEFLVGCQLKLRSPDTTRSELIKHHRFIANSLSLDGMGPPPVATALLMRCEAAMMTIKASMSRYRAEKMYRTAFEL